MADLDVISLAEARLAVADPSADESLLATVVSGLSRFMDERCGPIVQRTVTGERHSGGRSSIWLRHRPVASITTVTEYHKETPVIVTEQLPPTFPSESFIAEPRKLVRGDETSRLLSGRLLRAEGTFAGRWYRGHSNIVVTYVAGRFTSTDTVDERWKEAAYVILSNAWGQWAETTQTFDEYEVPLAGFPAFSMPNAAAELLAGELRPRGVVVA